ncbi:MAG TPA: inositol monophosphatase family protein [Candidatus Binatia bacterium]|jgi:myo-inositol-1(or 4)-monophosphatase|nr:inositol monophosphatase family protein [Candidatus Binatia bacterium]
MDDLALRTLAVRLAAEAAAVHRAGRAGVLHVETKSSRTDLVSEVDREAERVIVDGIRRVRPDDAVLGEEGGAHDGTSGVRWIIDPLDGTTNYVYRYPAYAVSIGVEVDGVVRVGVVHDSVHDQVYTAVLGGGAFRDDAPIAAGRCDELATALLATGFQYRADVRARQAATLLRVLPLVRDVRRGGAASLDLCWVADGRLDLYYEGGLAEWDLAAGALIAAEAGATVRRFDPADGPTPLIIAGAPALVDPLEALLLGANP